ncbi:CP2 transcription factor-domain-containing protein [Cokeromyces recurvatus]|uniref:CP2 transcription factor-domain-containing protein n=1 Tax=Cokeromyces recurvatus TaxID=90255 RepID=UPI00221F6DDB|nr:CP2 transcription factor-domain-containing protein [Cokeromyces recurvatus]KAI7900676.1 CP2 transcription factor-domain-containing protein [Cokeromyces recurvatus]
MLSNNNNNNNNNQQLSYYQGSSSIAARIQGYQPHHQIYRCYYHSPNSLNSSPLSSPQILSHYYPPIMDTYHQLQQPILSLSPSPPTSCLSINNNNTMSSNVNTIRYDIALEAPTAASQKIDETPLTYLNKGQYYIITLKDKDRYDGDIISTVSITFHEESYRASAKDYWKFWLTQQKNTNDAKAIEIDLTRSNGAQAIEGNRQFDRISFRWNGKLGASVQIRFNCLSTDFSRIKGVKGIPLRLQIESEQQPQQPATLPHMIRSPSQQIERTFCRIKLFRDKGAERKNKDDAKHIERQLEKLRGKSGEPHPLWLAYSPTSPITLFREIVSPDEFDNHPLLLDDHRPMLQMPNNNNGLLLPLPSSMKRSFHNDSLLMGVNNNNTIGIDPNYIPQRRRRLAKLSILVKFPSTDVYRAIYLEHLTVKELIDKLTQRMEVDKEIANVLRKIETKDKKSLIVKVDDDVIQDMNEEQDIQLEIEENPEDTNTMNLILNF